MAYTVTSDNVDTKTCETKSAVWKELLFSFVASLPFFTHGLEGSELYASAHSGQFMSSSETVPWNATALIVAAAISAPIYSYIVDRHGRKVGVFIVSLTQGVSCIPLFLPPDQIRTLCLHLVAGISTGGLFTVLPSYICEINSIGCRGFSLSLMLLFTSAGCLMKLVVDLEIIMYVMAAMVMLQLLAVAVLVESPSYLVMVGNDKKAKSTIARLRCLDEDNLIVSTELDRLKEESYRAKSHGKFTIVNIFMNLIWRDAIKIAILIHTTMVLCGSISFLDQDKTLMQLKMASDPERTLVLSGMCAGSLVTVLLIKFTERKYLLCFGYITMVLSLGVLAVYTQVELTVTTHRWLPVTALGVLVFGYGVAWGLPTVIFAEVFNLEIRATMISALFTYSQLIKLLQLHSYFYIENYIGIYTMFYIFAAINLYGGIYALFALPDIKNKTVKQIEKQLKRIPLIKML